MANDADSGDRDPRRDDIDDVLDVGGDEPRWYSRVMRPARRHPRGARAALWLASGLVLGVALVSGLQSATTGSARKVPSAASAPAQPPLTKEQSALASVLALTEGQGKLTNYLRQTSTKGACAVVPVGQSPARAITQAIGSSLPGYSVEDLSRTIDQFSGLCALEMRATHPGGATVALSVASPTTTTPVAAFTLLETGIVTHGSETTKYVTAFTRTGWTVLIGASGRSADLPPAQALLELAQDPSLLW